MQESKQTQRGAQRRSSQGDPVGLAVRLNPEHRSGDRAAGAEAAAAEWGRMGRSEERKGEARRETRWVSL